jgi:hypothetical protein
MDMTQVWPIIKTDKRYKPPKNAKNQRRKGLNFYVQPVRRLSIAMNDSFANPFLWLFEFSAGSDFPALI